VRYAVAFQLAFLKAAKDSAWSLVSKAAFALSGLAVVHHELEVRTIAVAVFADLDLALPHRPGRCHFVAAKSVKPRYYHVIMRFFVLQ
jgi:hypothetical protein